MNSTHASLLILLKKKLNFLIILKGWRDSCYIYDSLKYATCSSRWYLMKAAKKVLSQILLQKQKPKQIRLESANTQAQQYQKK